MEEKETGMSTQAIFKEQLANLRQQRCFLLQLQGPTPGASYLLGNERMLVGKSPDCQIVVKDVTVSRVHFEIRNEAGRFLIKDRGSTNGTFLDGSSVKEAYLRPGATIQVGEVVFRFQTEYDAVKIAPSSRESFGSLLGRSLRMREIFALLERISPTESTVLLFGDTGTGKGVAAQAIHENSKRRKGPLVIMDCGAVAKNLIESELFGHVRGAFTGAVALRKGALEISKGGTLFIDELDDLPLDLQPKLLRAIEERVFVRLGSSQPIRFDARLIAASKKDLWKLVQAGLFREDLYFRLSVVSIELPPLRQRPEDVPLLFDRFSGERGKRFEELPPEIQTQWMHHAWPGNIRELRNAVERSQAFEDDAVMGVGALSVSASAPPGMLMPDYMLPFKEAKEKLVDAFEHEYIKRLIERAPFGVAGAARLAQIDRKHLYTLLEKHGMGRSEIKK